MRSTSTSLSNGTMEFWKSSRGTVIRIEVLVVVITVMQLFLVSFGSWRRRCTNFFIQKGVLAAYTLSSPLISYTLGSMQSSAVKSNMYAVWAVSVYILFGSTDSITAYSLTDNEQLMRQIFQFALGVFYMFFFLVLIGSVYLESHLLRMIPLIGLMAMAAFSFFQRLGACQMASASWRLNKLVADYMYQEHTMGEPPYLYDPDSMRGYHYLVDWPLGMPKVGHRTSYVTDVSTMPEQIIDIEMVWKNNGGRPLLSTDLKDACLSFSLFHLLRRRFFGFECGESSQPKTHDFVFKGLLSKKQNSGEIAIVDYDRVFKVIEVELAFMYDFFFTKYAAIYYDVTRFVLPLLTVTLTVVTAFLILTAGGELWPSSFAGYGMDSASVFLHTTATDVGITVAILVCIAVLQVVQMLHYWTSIWGRVSFACQRVRGSVGFCMGLKERFVQIGVSMSGCWCYQREEKLGQYSLLESVSNSSKQCLVTKVVASFENLFLNSNWFNHSEEQFINVEDDVWRVIRKPGKTAKLLPAVKKALVQSLGLTQGKLTNGESSLLSNGADDLLWACKLRPGDQGTSWSWKQENQVCVILTWHIATCYCNKELLAGTGVTEDLKEHHEVGTRLSTYTAYLVGSQPKLLPGHHYDTRIVFMVVAEEAIRQSKGIHQDDETIYRKGLRLGEQLKNMEAARCWKILADFWAEMLFYLAPSDNVKEHVECLAKGGELITHLWALLTHAGILDRGKRNNVTNDTENPGDGPLSSTTCAAPSTSETNQPSTTSNPTVQRTERDFGETRDSGTDQSDPRELSYGAAWRLRHARSYLDKCAEGAASAAYRATNEPAMRGTNCAQTVEMVVHQPANPVPNGEGARNESSGLSEIEEIA